MYYGVCWENYDNIRACKYVHVCDKMVDESARPCRTRCIGTYEPRMLPDPGPASGCCNGSTRKHRTSGGRVEIQTVEYEGLG